jgi:cytochrome c-type biogenesis protein CcmH
MLPVLAFVLYDFLGASEQLELREKLEQRARLLREGDSAAAGLLNQDIVKSLQALETRDAENPLYPVLLARLQLETGRVASAVMSYQRAVKLVPEDSVIYGEYAQALFFQENNQATDRVIALAETALSLSPQNHTALELLGIGAFQRENYLAAIDYWQRAMMGLAPGSAARESVEAGVATARAKLTPEQQQHLAAQTVTLDVAVTIVPELATLPPETTVFVYARAWQGSPMPLAIKRLTLAQLPTTVSLTENDAMNPAASLASAEQVELVARVSISGSAVPASGDLMGTRGPIAPRDKNQALTLMIDQRLP